MLRDRAVHDATRVLRDHGCASGAPSVEMPPADSRNDCPPMLRPIYEPTAGVPLQSASTQLVSVFGLSVFDDRDPRH
ncbi:hypothetical protein WOLCODRAFT_155861 [Wolfiporia cocos MD-104 SS10]|uniref:Uncharacterized protein n=1 Tax=Wolfiporia cocos (strain MD-104) TaxID=742152 RepID=A0A2H3IZ11_WOLCO|nr:hypothetical protein WOLCODRAFT_155861 [Wolfiporia cocos MD-104 SS10]